jgi:hypothetical protein
MQCLEVVQLKKVTCLFVVLMTFFSAAQAAERKPCLLFVPHDNRPVSYQYTVDTVKAAGFRILTPPDELLGSRHSSGNPEAIGGWIAQHLAEADAVVLSGDMLLYGGLVPSRKHHDSEEVIAARLNNLALVKKSRPEIKVYVFASIMRSPKFSAGGVEPDYYEQYGPWLFKLTALQDKAEMMSLTNKEKMEMSAYQHQLPQAVLHDWMERRQKNLNAHQQLIGMVQKGDIDQLVLGKDDNAPYSQTHRENRILLKTSANLPKTSFQLLAGVDELGMVLLTRAVNDLTFQVPSVAVKYAPGCGPATVPLYSDEEVGKSVAAHLTAAGMVPLLSPELTDFTLVINTDEFGITREANSPENLPDPKDAVVAMTHDIKEMIDEDIKVAVADISFANGADNALMAELAKRHLLARLLAYSGWNTPNNSIGFVAGQGRMALEMKEWERKQLLAVRLLDDWGYQANVRSRLVQEIIVPSQGSYFYLDDLKPVLTQAAEKQFDSFAKQYLQEFNISRIKATFPWNRMFEIGFEVDIKN